MRPSHLLIGLFFITKSVLAANAADTVVAFHDNFWSIISPDAEIVELASGFSWSEGPTWDKTKRRLYFSDVPENTAYMWSPGDGVTVFMSPSGLQNNRMTGFREPGSNGLLMTSNGHLLIANHGERAIESLEIESGLRRTIANNFQGRKLNSPNDIALSSTGTIYFTDPPYGLEGINNSPLKEQKHNGVYSVTNAGSVELIDDSLSFPNGVALSPDEQVLYVTVSDPRSAKIYKYVKGKAGFGEKSEFFDAQPYVDRGWPGLPDGMAVSMSGHVFATGPGGVFVLSEEGQALGLLRLEGATANCAFGLDGNTLFITSGNRLLAVKTMALAAGWQND